jgi:hypothetical protein
LVLELLTTSHACPRQCELRRNSLGCSLILGIVSVKTINVINKDGCAIWGLDDIATGLVTAMMFDPGSQAGLFK